MSTAQKIQLVQKYIDDFFQVRISNYRDFTKSEVENKRFGIWKLNRGDELLRHLHNIMGNVEERIYVENLIPGTFPTLTRFTSYLAGFRQLIASSQALLDANQNGEDTSYIILHIQEMNRDLIDFVDEIILIAESDPDFRIPYLEMRHALLTKDVESFRNDMNSMLATVSHAIKKVSEGFLHANIHLILKLLGFEIISEEETNIGRIDAVLRFTKIIYIFEFKLGTAQEAMDQIRARRYWEKYIIERKEIILVGVGFSEEERNISEFVTEEV